MVTITTHLLAPGPRDAWRSTEDDKRVPLPHEHGNALGQPCPWPDAGDISCLVEDKRVAPSLAEGGSVLHRSGHIGCRAH
jgi:hypothetical protein